MQRSTVRTAGVGNLRPMSNSCAARQVPKNNNMDDIMCTFARVVGAARNRNCNSFRPAVVKGCPVTTGVQLILYVAIHSVFFFPLCSQNPLLQNVQ